MDPEKHKERHILLHRMLDELVADYITHTEKKPSSSTMLELMEWSAQQMRHPDNEKQYFRKEE